jgi:hypothetical protein
MSTNVISLGHQDALGNRANAFIRSFRPPPPHGKITLGNELDHLGFSSGCSVFDSALNRVCNDERGFPQENAAPHDFGDVEK